MTTDVPSEFEAARGDYVHQLAMKSLFDRFNNLCEGAMAVDADARIVWLNEKYAHLLGLAGSAEALGRDVEDVIPNSLMRKVVQTGEPILLDVLQFGTQSFVVTRMPLTDKHGSTIGAIGFVLYDRLHYLKPLVERLARLQADIAETKQKLAGNRRAKYTMDSIVTNDPLFLEVKRKVRLAAGRDVPVLLLGETGTGKELLAHALHAESARAHGPFVAVNMAAFPENLLEAEFFGVAPGAYTGADRKGREGKMKLADGGTLFLDEIGDMPLPLQAKLLRALQEQEIEALGSNRVMKVDVRIIAASSVDLKRMVAEGKFRSDLYFRINVLPIQVPPLRERLSDLEVLCKHFLEDISERIGLPRREIAPSAIEALAHYEWPGNIRELRNVLEQATLLSERARLTAEDIATILPLPRERSARARAAAPTQKLADAVAEFERNTIREALEASGGKVRDAAELLGLPRATLYRKMSEFGLQTQSQVSDQSQV